MPTPMRNVRVPDDVWLAAMARARADGTALAGVIVDALRAYGSGGAAPSVAVGGTPIPVVADERIPPGVVSLISATDAAAVNLATGAVVMLAEVAERARSAPGGSRPVHTANCKCLVCKPKGAK